MSYSISDYFPPPPHPLHNRLQLKDAPNVPHGCDGQCVAPSRDVVHEVSVDRSFHAGPGPATREIKKTISLPEECSKSTYTRLHEHMHGIFSPNLKEMHSCGGSFTDLLLTGNVFITYSEDTAKDMIQFVKFLTDQGFKPAVSPVVFPSHLIRSDFPYKPSHPCLSFDRSTFLIIRSEQ